MAVEVERTNPPTPPESTQTDQPSGWRRRSIATTAYAVIFLVYWKVFGLPSDPIQIFLWLWAFTVAWNVAAPWRSHLRFGHDWAAVVVALVLYQFSRGLADDLGTPLHVLEPIRFDRWIAGGQVPTVWLQQHFYTPGHVQWYDVIAAFVYFSHFVTSLIVGMVLWVRDRVVWAPYMRRFMALTVLGLAIYVIYPMAPPWWASEHGDLGAYTPRITNRGWSLLGLHTAGKIITQGQGVANPVAAMPSLHAAFALLVALFFIRRVRRRWTLVLLAYPALMGLTLMYTAEHYLLDLLAGWVCTLVVFAAVAAAESWWAARVAGSMEDQEWDRLLQTGHRMGWLRRPFQARSAQNLRRLPARRTRRRGG